jgi:hypothetical protein
LKQGEAFKKKVTDLKKSVKFRKINNHNLK